MKNLAELPSATFNTLLLPNVDARVKRIQSGMFNIIIMFGATRSGKSTFSRQLAQYMSKQLGAPFSLQQNVTFEADKLAQMANDSNKKNWCFILDEASNDLLSSDRANKFQLMLIKFYNIAAKYNQTHFILLPNVQQLKKDFLSDFHSCGFETVIKYNRKTQLYERGHGRAYNRVDMAKLYDNWKRNKLNDAMTSVHYGFSFSFSKEEPYWNDADEAEYQGMKDAFIENLGKKVYKGKKEKETDGTET